MVTNRRGIRLSCGGSGNTTDKPEILVLTIRFSLPLVLPPGRSFIGIWFIVTFKFFDLCAFSVAFFLSPPISISGLMVSVPMVSVVAIRVRIRLRGRVF